MQKSYPDVSPRKEQQCHHSADRATLYHTRAQSQSPRIAHVNWHRPQSQQSDCSNVAPSTYYYLLSMASVYNRLCILCTEARKDIFTGVTQRHTQKDVCKTLNGALIFKSWMLLRALCKRHMLPHPVHSSHILLSEADV